MWVLVLITMIGGKFDGAKAFDVFEDRKSCEVSLLVEATMLGMPDIEAKAVWLLDDNANLTADIYKTAQQRMPDGKTFRQMKCVTHRPQGG